MADFFKLKSKHYERLEEIKAIFGNDDLRMTKLFYYLKGYDMTNYERFQNYIDKGIQGLLGDLDQKNLEKSLLYKYQQTYIKNIEKFVEQVNNFNNLYNIGKSIYLTTKLIKQKYNEIQDEIDKKKEGLK